MTPDDPLAPFARTSGNAAHDCAERADSPRLSSLTWPELPRPPPPAQKPGRTLPQLRTHMTIGDVLGRTGVHLDRELIMSMPSVGPSATFRPQSYPALAVLVLAQPLRQAGAGRQVLCVAAALRATFTEGPTDMGCLPAHPLAVWIGSGTGVVAGECARTKSDS
jgi:hypothetical protein